EPRATSDERRRNPASPNPPAWRIVQYAMLRDLRHAVRLLVQAKGWTAVVVLSLALGIGANTALFSAANGLLLKTVPVRDPQSLVRLRWYGRNQMANDSSDYGFTGKTPSGENIRTTVSYAMY